MTTNLLIYYPDIPANKTGTVSATEHASYPLSNAATGPRTETYRLAAEQSDDLFISYDCTSARTVDHFAIIRADMLAARGCKRVALRGSSSAYDAVAALVPKAWYDASRGVTVDSSNLVSSWNDNSTNNKDATQSTTANKPQLTRADNLENRFSYSEEMGQTSAWAPNATSVSSNATTAPDGETTADKIVENSATAQHYFQRNENPTILQGETVVFSVYAKAAERSWLIFQRGGSAFSGTKYQFVNLSTGATGSSSGGMSVTVTDAGSGWYRISSTETASATGGANLLITVSTGNGTISYAGDGSSGIYLWGAQVRGSTADSTYLATTSHGDFAGINGCRALWFDGTNDELTQGAAQSSFFGTQGKTAFVVFQPRRIVGNQHPYAGANGYTYFRVSTAAIRAFNFDGSSDTATSTVSATIGGTFIGTLIHDTSNISVSVNGETDVNTASGATSNLADTQYIGSSNGGGYYGGLIAEVIMFNSALSSGNRAIVYDYLAAKYSRTPSYSTVSLQDETLIGPREEDLISKFTTSSAYRYWWVQFGVDDPSDTSDFGHSKHMIGSSLDLGREPIYPALQMGSAQITRAQREGRITLKLRWEGVTNAMKNTLIEEVTSKADTNPIVLHDQNDYALHGFKALNCTVTDITFTPRTSEYGDLEMQFEEAI